MVIVKMDGRSTIARQFKNANHPDISISALRTAKLRGHYALHINHEVQGDPKVNLQNRSIAERGAEANAKVLEDILGLKTSVLYWRD